MNSKKNFLIFNPSCSKCRTAEELLKNAGVDFEEILYLKGQLSYELLAKLPHLLQLSYPEMIRQNEDLFEELGLAAKNLSQAEWIALLLQHPILLERPIFIFQERAIIARPPERIFELLKKD